MKSTLISISPFTGNITALQQYDAKQVKNKLVVAIPYNEFGNYLASIPIEGGFIMPAELEKELAGKQVAELCAWMREKENAQRVISMQNNDALSNFSERDRNLYELFLSNTKDIETTITKTEIGGKPVCCICLVVRGDNDEDVQIQPLFVMVNEDVFEMLKNPVA